LSLSTNEDFVEGIKPVMGEEESGLDYQIEEGVFKSICREAGRDQKNRYCIFIDEINRGNVASIFGELITLIEPDKRLGQNQALTVTLPYSKEEFGVPSNLDIIGTMNTADRSVEALEVGPNPSLLRGSEVAGVDLEALLATLNARLEHLLDRDHCLGHSHFWKIKDQGLLDDLRKVFAQGVLPQMQEYFYGDMGKIGLVLGSAFVEPKPRQEVKFAAFDHEDRELLQDKEVYRLIDPMTLPAEAFKAIYD
jgi:5-methylcytosine-specific restriction endonuclease McrBC GTP-binding regulatory subunit McrB